MQIRPLQFNITTKSTEHKHYLEAEGAVDTSGLVKPLPGKGHLVHDSVSSAPVYFVKDIAYDIKSLKNGIKGTANDHQLGRLNDVGLQVGGIGIATYLASKTTNPKARIMEYVGLGTFLTAMNLYPKIAINAPSRLIHGYNIGQWYIDDQGRKKSVNQDSNYRPMDLYRGDVKGETLDEIGDKMGIPRDIHNRHEIIKEQTRKNSTQSNTLWMLTAGLATPVMTALGCYGLENYVVSPQLEKSRNKKYNQLISNTLEQTKGMELDVSKLNENDMSIRVSKMLNSYKGREIPPEELDRVLKVLTENMTDYVAEGLKEDARKLLTSSISVDGELAEKMVNAGKNKVSKDLKEYYEAMLVPTKEEIQDVFKKVDSNINFSNNTAISLENAESVKKSLRELVDTKIQNNLQEELSNAFINNELSISPDSLQEIKAAIIKGDKYVIKETIEKAATKAFEQNGTDINSESYTNFVDELYQFREQYHGTTKIRDDVFNKMFEAMPEIKTKTVTEESIKKFTDLAKVLGEFNEYQAALDKCHSFKFENAPETVLARSYGKFEKTLIKELGITTSDMKKMKDSATFTEELLDKKISELCKDEKRYEKAVKNLGKAISEMEVNLNGNSTDKSNLLDLINAIENNYNNTAKRLESIGGFDSTLTKLINQETSTLGNSITTRQELFNYLDGKAVEGIAHNTGGLGSAKHLEVSRALERYQGVKNSFYRILHTLEVYKRTDSTEGFLATLREFDNEFALARTDKEYLERGMKLGRKTLLTGTPSEHTQKLHLTSSRFYKDFMNMIWAPSLGDEKSKGFITDNMQTALNDSNNIEKGSVLDRFANYITRFRDIIGNNDIDFTKQNHKTNPLARENYTHSSKTRMAFFNLIGQTPVDMAQKAAKRQYGTNKWVKIVSGVTAGVFAGTILAQFGFGKIRNPQNIKKQVNDDTSK